jgi:AraC family transcriptional regulator
MNSFISAPPSNLVSDPTEFVSHVPGHMWLAPTQRFDDEISVSGFDFPPNSSTLRTNRHAVLAYRQACAHMRRWLPERDHHGLDTVGAGDLTLKDSGSACAWAWDAEIRVVQIHVEPQLLLRTATEICGRRFTRVQLRNTDKLRDDKLLSLVNDLVNEASVSQLGKRSMTRALKAQLAIHLVRHHCELVEGVPSKGLDPASCTRLIEHVLLHLDAELSVTGLAALVHLSPDHFGRAFRAAFNCTPHQYVTRTRLEAARDLLRENARSLATIAAQTGFADQSHLCRWFKRAYGVTPGQWRDGQAG